MEQPDPLSRQFAASRPEELAVVLSGESANEVADFLARLPADVAAPVLTRLPSWQLNRLLGLLEPDFICRMLMVAPQDGAVAIVSHLHASRYSAILGAASGAEHRKLQQLLEYPSHSLAAMVSTNFTRVDGTTPCATFCHRLSASSDSATGPVIVVDVQGRYTGIASVQALYARRNRARPVGELASRIEPLSGMTSADNALSSRLWLRFTELPVVDQRHRLLGVVSRAALQRVAGRDTPAEFSMDRLVGELASGYLKLCGNLLESLLGDRR